MFALTRIADGDIAAIFAFSAPLRQALPFDRLTSVVVAG
jgi:hypothetical protein